MRATGRQADRVLLDRLGLRRARGLPHPRGRALPGPDLALRRVEARRRGADRGLRRRLRLHRADLPLRLDPRRALHARARLRLLSARSSATPRACACSATAARRSPTCTSRTASTRCSPRAARHDDEPGAHVYNLGTDETIVVDDSVALITEHLGVSPEIEHTGGRRGWIGDSPLIHLDTARIRDLGWEPQLTIERRSCARVDWFEDNEYAWRERSTEGRDA